MCVSKLQGSASTAAESGLGRGVREAGTGGGQVGSAAASVTPHTRSLSGSGLSPWKGTCQAFILPRSLPGIRHESACHLKKDGDSRSGHDLNFVTGALCPRTVTFICRS